MSRPDPSPETRPDDLDPTRTIPLGSAPFARPAEPTPETHGPAAEVVGGPMDGLVCRVDGAAVTIGRSPDCDLALVLDPAASKRHARIEREGQHYWLEDLGSSNGTYLGDHRITERVAISPGTTILVGQTQFELLPG